MIPLKQSKRSMKKPLHFLSIFFGLIAQHNLIKIFPSNEMVSGKQTMIQQKRTYPEVCYEV